MITRQQLVNQVAALCIQAACSLGQPEMRLLQDALAREKSPLGREMIEQIIQNHMLAHQRQVPMCQDTGIAVVFVRLGWKVQLDFELNDAIEEGVRLGYAQGYLRKSVLDPITRHNTHDNTPPVIHLELTAGDELTIIVAPKGAGSENMGQVRLLKPGDGTAGIVAFVVECVKTAGGNPCPPILLGIGIGGTMEMAALLSKKALLRPAGQPHDQADIAALEHEIVRQVNQTGIGPQGLGGTVTAMGAHILTYPTHIACLPVAVSFQCHAMRHAQVTLHA